MEDDLARSAAIVLALVFAFAALTKARHASATAKSFDALRLPAPRALAVVVPLVELALAVLLVVSPALGGWSALGLLGVFTAVLARAIRTGNAVPCACFGSARREPVSGTDLVRNAMLAALAVVATGVDGAAIPSFPAIVTVTVTVALGRVLLGVLELRHHPRPHGRRLPFWRQ